MRRMFIAVVVGVVVMSAVSARPVADAQQASLDPLVISPTHYRLVFENDYVRVIRQQMAGRDTVPMHQHSLGAVMVLVTDQLPGPAVVADLQGRDGITSVALISA